MNHQALLKLKNNPHYKMSESQLQELREYENEPVIVFHSTKLTDNKFEQHKTKVKIYKKNNGANT